MIGVEVAFGTRTDTIDDRVNAIGASDGHDDRGQVIFRELKAGDSVMTQKTFCVRERRIRRVVPRARREGWRLVPASVPDRFALESRARHVSHASWILD